MLEHPKYLDIVNEAGLASAIGKGLWHALNLMRIGFCNREGRLLKGSPTSTSYKSRNGSGQGHSTVKFPVRKGDGRSARLLILYSVPVVNI